MRLKNCIWVYICHVAFYNFIISPHPPSTFPQHSNAHFLLHPIPLFSLPHKHTQFPDLTPPHTKTFNAHSLFPPNPLLIIDAYSRSHVPHHTSPRNQCLLHAPPSLPPPPPAPPPPLAPPPSQIVTSPGHSSAQSPLTSPYPGGLSPGGGGTYSGIWRRQSSSSGVRQTDETR